LVAACGDDDDEGATESTEETTADEGASGGELVLGAEQFPECINMITQCANSSWAHWVGIQQVLPKLMELDPDGNYVASPLLDGEPELSGEGTDNGTGPFTTTYTIREEANWNDGTPITCADIEFTWHAYQETTGSLTTSPTEHIASVTAVDGDEKECAIEWDQPFAAWPDTFGSTTQYVFKADEFTQNDIANDMLTEINFSGGPFVLESFDPSGELTLVRNEEYWDDERMPLVDSVTVIAQSDQDTEINALVAGEVAAIYPQPAPGIADSLAAENVDFQFGAGTTWEALFFSQASQLNPDTVLANPVVREALMFAVDREAILSEIIAPNFPETELLHCLGWVPTVGDWCDNTDFEDVTYDPAHVAELLEGDGWARGADGIYAKDGQRLSITWQTVAGNLRREAIQALVVPAAAEAGIELTPDNVDADTLFQQRVPQVQTELALYAQVSSPDPSVATLFSCDNLSTPENEFSGQNTYGYCNEEASELMRQADRTVDEAERLDLTHQIGDLLREDSVGLPFYQLPLITAWRTDQVSGPIGEFTDSPLSGFWNMWDWSVV
jgi:peptide/nickel transport system substrate-binding protein